MRETHQYVAAVIMAAATTLVAAPMRAFFFRIAGTTPTRSPPTPAFHWSSFWRMLACSTYTTIRTGHRVSPSFGLLLTPPTHTPTHYTTRLCSYRSKLARRVDRSSGREHELSQSAETHTQNCQAVSTLLARLTTHRPRAH